MSFRKNVVSPYCATCKKAGEPENVYLSHFTKDTPGGKVICPTIKNFRCKECGESGHIANEKYCPVMRDRCSRVSIQIRGGRHFKETGAPTVEKKKSVESFTVNRFAVNRFALAFDDSSDTEGEDEEKSEVKKVVKEDFPVLASVTLGGGGSTTNISFKSYKDMLEKPVVISKGNEVQLNFRVLSNSALSSASSTSSTTSRVTPLKMATTTKTRRSWASDTSSDEEDD